MARSIPKIRQIGPSLPYSDGAEDHLLEILDNVRDRSDGSDDLAARITDWPTRYHLSPARSHLLRPFAIGAGRRILEIGAGAGALTRHLGETGAEVVALEGNARRAEAVALRCEDLGNVEILCGPLAALEEEGFDLAIAVGVLEYAGAAAGGGSTPKIFLTQIRKLVRPGGALLLAIENQLGLRYLLGAPEDHVGASWAGVLDYPGRPGVRTFSRRELQGLLETAGFPRQRWLYPFPDYKLPRTILTEAAYRESDAERLVDQMVRFPSRADATSSGRDERRAHRVWVRAGLGPEVAPSFLVLAAGEATALEPWLDPQALAWCFSAERRRGLRRMKIVRREAAGRSVEARALDPPAELPPWLEQRPAGRAAWVAGTTIEQLALDACHAHDLDRLREALGRWMNFLAPRAVSPELLDVELSNFVLAENGEVVYVDDEWRATEGVDADLAVLRALWYFARDLVQTRAAHPWPATITIDQLAENLADLAGVAHDPAAFERLRAAETKLIAAVTGWPAEKLESALVKLGQTSNAPREDPRLAKIEAKLRDKTGELEAIHRSKTWRWWMTYLRLRRLVGL